MVVSLFGRFFRMLLVLRAINLHIINFVASNKNKFENSKHICLLW